MSNLSIPNSIANGQSADGNEVGANFDAVETWANNEAVHKDGSVAMTGALTLPADPTSALQAATKQYVDGRSARWVRTTDVPLSTTTSVEAAITPETEVNDVDGWWSSGSTFTVPENGLYAIGIWMDLNKAYVDSNYTFDFWFGDATHKVVAFNPAVDGKLDNTNFHYGCGGVRYLTAGKQYALRYSFSSGIGGESVSITIQEAAIAIARLSDF